MEFRKITLSDKDLVKEMLQKSEFKACEHGFANNYIWSSVYDIQIARINDRIILGSNKDNSYLYPVGSGDVKPAIDGLLDYCKNNGLEFKMHSVVKEGVDLLKTLYPEKFNYIEDRDGFDYIYENQKLALLSGKKLSAKRNHINYFKQTYTNWEYHEITPQNIDAVWNMSSEWCIANDCFENGELRKETCAVYSAFEHFFDLDMFGGYITDGERIVGFTIASALTNNTVDVHIEKAFSDVRGAYPMINQQFVLNSCKDYKYINREEDTGSEGLRKAKMSYRPDILLEKYYVELA